jgi:hypothetical protein
LIVPINAYNKEALLNKYFGWMHEATMISVAILDSAGKVTLSKPKPKTILQFVHGLLGSVQQARRCSPPLFSSRMTCSSASCWSARSDLRDSAARVCVQRTDLERRPTITHDTKRSPFVVQNRVPWAIFSRSDGCKGYRINET